MSTEPLTRNPPTICRCGAAKSYHGADGRKSDHPYEPRYEPEAWREGYRAATLDAARAAQDVAGRERYTYDDPLGRPLTPRHPVTPPPDALREALEREHYQNLKAHAPDFPHSHPGTFSERCGICAAKSECLSCAALRAQGVVQSPEREALAEIVAASSGVRWHIGGDDKAPGERYLAAIIAARNLLATPVDESRDPA
jgi:hypothetical protein